MEAQEIVNLVLAGAGALALIALAFALLSLAHTLHSARKTVEDMKTQLDPTLKHVENITASLEPAVAKIEPLVDRVALTVDAANLEIMRLDTVMEDLGEISNSLTSAVGAVDTLANAPLKLADKASAKISGLFGGKQAGAEAKALGEKKTAGGAVKEEKKISLEEIKEKVAVVADLAETVKAGYVTVTEQDK